LIWDIDSYSSSSISSFIKNDNIKTNRGVIIQSKKTNRNLKLTFLLRYIVK